MFTKNPYQFSPFYLPTAGYQLAGMMVENQMRLMLAMTDATFRGKNPFLSPAASEVEDSAPEASTDPVDTVNCTTPPIARMAKKRVTPDDLKRKRARKSSPPPAMPKREMPLHPAE